MSPRWLISHARGYLELGLVAEAAAELDQLAPELRDGDVVYPVHDWLAARGAAFAQHWAAEQFLCLNRSIDAHAIDPRTVTVPSWLLAFVGDQLVPPSEVRELALQLPELRAHRELRSRYGHDAFLKEPVHLGAFLREVLS